LSLKNLWGKKVRKHLKLFQSKAFLHESGGALALPDFFVC
jgi:hypothetical protein